MVVIACEYSATATKADDVIVVRPGTTPALALGLANVILQEKLYDADYVRQLDRPAAARAHGHAEACCEAEEVFGGLPAKLGNQTMVQKPGEAPPGTGSSAT